MSVDVLPIESELAALLADGHSRTRATELLIERAITEAADASTVVLVEGLSDQIALEIVARRRGRNLGEERTSIVPMGGATNIRRFLEMFGPDGRGAKLGGLYDASEERHVARSLERAGFGDDLDRLELEELGFFACDSDLEDEMIRSLGIPRVEQLLDEDGRLTSFRRMQNEPFHRGRALEQQIHRFIASRKYRNARLLAEALDPASVPRPLEALLAHV